jgi:hypothetical protein
MSSRPSVGTVAFATSVYLCASLHAQPAGEPAPPESSPALPEIKINTTRSTVKPSARPKKPVLPTPRVAPTARTAPAHITRTAGIVRARPAASQRSPAPQAATSPPAASAQGSAGGLGNGVPPVVSKFQLPQESFSITASVRRAQSAARHL